MATPDAGVSSRAVDAVADIVRGMLQTVDGNVMRRMKRNHASVSIIGAHQETGDVPAFWGHRYSTGVQLGTLGYKYSTFV